MPVPFPVYFAGIGTVVAALGVGFGGAYFLMNTNPPPKETTSLPHVRYEATTITKVDKVPEPAPVQEVVLSEPASTKPVETKGSAVPNPGWVAEPPPQANHPLPVIPYVAPIAPSHARAPAAPQPAPTVSAPQNVKMPEPVVEPPLKRVPAIQIEQNAKPEKTARERKVIADRKRDEKKRRVVEADQDDKDDRPSASIFSSGPPRSEPRFFLFGN